MNHLIEMWITPLASLAPLELLLMSLEVFFVQAMAKIYIRRKLSEPLNWTGRGPSLNWVKRWRNILSMS